MIQNDTFIVLHVCAFLLHGTISKALNDSTLILTWLKKQRVKIISIFNY